MFPRRVPVLLAILAVAATAFSSDHAFSQAEPEKRPGPVPQATPTPVRPGDPAAGPTGSPVPLDRATVQAQIDSSLERMELARSEALALSISFGELALQHHGADRSEILMMQRMSDAMASMAGEVITTLRQYKTMLDDETASDTGAMKADVQELKAAIEVIAGEVDDAVQTLHRLQGQFGQG